MDNEVKKRLEMGDLPVPEKDEEGLTEEAAGEVEGGALDNQLIYNVRDPRTLDIK